MLLCVEQAHVGARDRGALRIHDDARDGRAGGRRLRRVAGENHPAARLRAAREQNGCDE